MFERLRSVLLRFLRVPPEPEPPFGAPQSVRVFRASRNFYKLRLLGWFVGQVGALVGIAFSLWLLHEFQTSTRKPQADAASTRSTNSIRVEAAQTNELANVAREKNASRRGENWKRPVRERFGRIAANWPEWILPAVSFFEFVGIGLFFIQAFLTYLAVRLDYELRWYVVTDRSLRIRSGVWSVQEMTMSFANLQQVMVSQGPVQRLLGIADLRVESAGGGAAANDPHQAHQDSAHTGVFHGVDNAAEVRDLILARLRNFRESGLGDPDEAQSHSLPDETSPADALAAARELLTEARALRGALCSPQ